MQAARATEGCPTGDAVITPGFDLPATHVCNNHNYSPKNPKNPNNPNNPDLILTDFQVIHTVGPRYTLKYLTAAENALHACYSRSLELLMDHKLHSIAFPQVYMYIYIYICVHTSILYLFH